HGSAMLHVLGYDVHVQGDVDPSGTFRLVGGKFMYLAEAGLSYFQVIWDQNGLTIDNGSSPNYLYTRLKETCSWADTVVKEVWDTEGNYTRERWSAIDAHTKETWDKAGNHCITGRTFCTATALLVLMADRAPRPDAVVEPTVSAPVA